MTTESELWSTIPAAIELSNKSRSTILRWVRAKYVRSMVARGRVLVRKADVTETERALFDGEEPRVRQWNDPDS